MEVHGHPTLHVTCPAILEIEGITLLACIRTFETTFLQVRDCDGAVVCEAPVHGRVVEMVAVEPHLVLVYEDGSMDQFTFELDLVRDDDIYWWEPALSSCTVTFAPILMRVTVPDCNYVQRIAAVNPTTGAVTFTFNCGLDGHPSLGIKHTTIPAEAHIVYWNCETKKGYSLKAPTPVVSYLMFAQAGSEVMEMEHLIAVGPQGSIFVWRIDSATCEFAGEIVLPRGLTLPRVFAFEYYTLSIPALELFSIKWEDGTVALYDVQELTLLQWVKSKPAIRTPWQSLEVEEADPEEVDLYELEPKVLLTTGFEDSELRWFAVGLVASRLATILYTLFD